MPGGPGRKLALDVERKLIERDVRVRLREVEARRDHTVVERERCLDQAGDSGRGFQVAQVGLDRAKSTASSWLASLGQDGSERGRLDGISQERARAMCLDIINLSRRDIGLAVGI